MNQELRPGLCIVDLFANQLSFHTVKRSDSVARANHTQKLNNILLSSTSQPNTIIVITDASVRKGHYAISIAHGWQSRRLVFNSEYAAVNVTPAEAETFALRDGIGQATSLEGIDKIVVITNSISCAQKLSTCQTIQNKDILLPYQDPSDHFSAEILQTPSSSGTALARTNGHYTTKWTSKLNHT